jgi:tetratricopeptide (TPR) repeat protein
MPSDQTQNEIMIRPTLTHSRSDRLPLTSVNNYYQEAKRLEYDERNLDKAIQFYELAIKNHEKVDSAIKDLAAALHQRGNTCEAVEFLLKHRSFYKGDLEKYDNLTMNLKKQIHAPSGKNLNKHLLVIVDKPDRDGIFKLFANNSRIVSVKFYTDLSFSEEFDENCNKQQCYCLISFLSYSAAKKTFDSLRTTKPPCIYWVNINKLVVC